MNDNFQAQKASRVTHFNGYFNFAEVLGVNTIYELWNCYKFHENFLKFHELLKAGSHDAIGTSRNTMLSTGRGGQFFQLIS